MPRSRPAGRCWRGEWYFVGAAFDPDRRRVLLIQEPQKAYARDESPAQREVIAEVAPGEAAGPLSFAARLDPASSGAKASAHFNGKIDSPRLYRRALPAALLRLTIDQPAAPAYGADLVGAWDFALDMSSDRIRDRPQPPRRKAGQSSDPGMKGWNWDASELDWRRAPGQYGAIHFHDDDLYDAGWETDVVFEVPRPSAQRPLRRTASGCGRESTRTSLLRPAAARQGDGRSAVPAPDRQLHGLCQ